MEKRLKRRKTDWDEAERERCEHKWKMGSIGADLTVDEDEDDDRLMAKGGPLNAVMFHMLAEEVGAMGGRNLPMGPLSNLLGDYLSAHDQYGPEDAKYLTNHRGHLMFVRPEETHISPELVRSTTLSGTESELITSLSALKAAGYTEVTIQLVHDHEAALEDWAKVFAQVA